MTTDTTAAAAADALVKRMGAIRRMLASPDNACPALSPEGEPGILWRRWYPYGNAIWFHAASTVEAAIEAAEKAMAAPDGVPQCTFEMRLVGGEKVYRPTGRHEDTMPHKGEVVRLRRDDQGRLVLG